MAGTNPDDNAADNSDAAAEDSLRQAKKGLEVETPKGADESDDTSSTEDDDQDAGDDDDGQTDDDSQDDDEDDSELSDFVKEFPNIKGDTPEEYAKNLEATKRQSDTEGKRLYDENLELKRQLAAKSAGDDDDSDDDTTAKPPINPSLLYAQKLVQRDIDNAYAKFAKKYPQTDDPAEYARFMDETAKLSAYYNSQNDQLLGEELYNKVASILDWKPSAVNDKDRLKAKLKDGAASTRTSSSTKPKSQSKISDAEVDAARKMGGWTEGKSDAQIRKELEAVT